MEITKFRREELEKIIKKNTHKESLKSQILEPLVEYKPSFKLAEIGMTAEMNWPIRLPKYDPNGTTLGEDYRGGKKAADSRIGNAGVSYNIKGGREAHLHSDLERRLFVCFAMNPSVLNIRTQYAISDELNSKKSRMKKTSSKKSRPIHTDFLLTLQEPGSSAIRYHSVSGKPIENHLLQKNQRRNLKEQRILSDWCTHEVLHKSSYSNTHYQNCWRLRQWMNKFEIDENRDKARAFAAALKKTTATGALIRVLRIVGKRVGIEEGLERQTFALAAFLGYITVSPDHKLSEDREIFLVEVLQHG